MRTKNQSYLYPHRLVRGTQFELINPSLITKACRNFESIFRYGSQKKKTTIQKEAPAKRKTTSTNQTTRKMTVKRFKG